MAETRTCPQCGRVEPATEPFCYCGYIHPISSGKPLILDLAAPDVFACPECGITTNSLKSYDVIRQMLFLLVIIVSSRRTLLGCPVCVRRLFRRQLLLNIPTAHVIWPALLILYLPYYLDTYSPGHSKAVIDARKPAKPPTRFALFWEAFGEKRYPYAFLIALTICFGFYGFDRTPHDLIEPGRVIFASALGCLIWLVVTDVRSTRASNTRSS